MDTLKTFFASQNKHSGLPNNHESNYSNSGRSMPMGNSLAVGVSGNTHTKLTNNHVMKRKDSDSYFYIMWRS